MEVHRKVTELTTRIRRKVKVATELEIPGVGWSYWILDFDSAGMGFRRQGTPKDSRKTLAWRDVLGFGIFSGKGERR
jgi:hypothetical protein